MEKQDLLDLGMDEELAKKVLIVHAKDIQAANAKTATAEQERDDLKGQLGERDKQLTKIKQSAGDNDELKEQIKTLQDTNKQTATDFQAKLDKQARDFKIEQALSNAQAKNPKAVKALLDLEEVKVDGDQLLGMEDQLKALKESDGYLFEDTEPDGSQSKGGVHIFPSGVHIFPKGNPSRGDKTKTLDDLSLAEQSKLYREDPKKWQTLANKS